MRKKLRLSKTLLKQRFFKKGGVMIDGHIHLEYGPLTVEYVNEFIQEAINKDIKEIQILDHAHRFIEFKELYEPLKKFPKQQEWLNNKQMKFKDSLADFYHLKEEVQKHLLPIKVTFGLEVCYRSGTEELIKDILHDYSFDFLVGAVHAVDDRLYDMPFSKEYLWEVKDVDGIYRYYYQTLIECAKTGIFSQIAHPDTIKLFNYYPNYDLKPTFKTFARILKQYGIKAECNTGCHYRYQHPDLGLSDDFLKILLEEGVEIITTSDAHHPQDVGNYIKEATRRIERFKYEKSYL